MKKFKLHKYVKTKRFMCLNCHKMKISKNVAENIEEEKETTLTEALRERDEMLEKAKSIIEGVIEDRNEKGLGASQDIKWLTRYKLLDKESYYDSNITARARRRNNRDDTL